jgi:hypothetical protein
MNPAMAEFMRRKRNYDRSKGDLYSAFIERCAELLTRDGRLAMITQQSFMFMSTMDKLRVLLLENTVVEAMAHLGPRAFDEVSGEKVNTTAFVLRREDLKLTRQEARGIYFRLVKEPDATSKRKAFEYALANRLAGQSDPHVYDYRQGDFVTVPGAPWAYVLSGALRNLFQTPWATSCAATKVHAKLEEVAEPRQGLATADNPRFVRHWWEMGTKAIKFDCGSLQECAESPEKWYPLMKGGGSKRWHGQQASIVNYGQNGRELKAWADPLYGNSGWSRIIKSTDKYFSPGLTYTAVSGKSFSCRIMPRGFCFDHAGNCLFSAQPTETLRFLALLSSEFIRGLMTILNPTLNVNVSDLKRLPVLTPLPLGFEKQGQDAVNLAILDSEEDETTYDFVEPPVWPDGVERVLARHRDLAAREKEINEEVYRLYEISPEDRKSIEEELASAPAGVSEAEEGDVTSEDEIEDEEADEASLTSEELAQRWVSYAVGIALGRFVRSGLEHFSNSDGLMLVLKDHPDDLPQRVIDILTAILMETEANRLVRSIVGSNGDLRDALAGYLLGPFFKTHVSGKWYRKRPVYWLLQTQKQSFNVYLFHERATERTLPTLQGKRYLGGRIFQLTQESEKAQEKESSSTGKEKAEWRRRAQQVLDELNDLEAFDEAITATNSEPIFDAKGNHTTARWTPEFDDGVLLNAAPLYRLTPAWKRVDAKLDLGKVWKKLKDGDWPWAKTAMRYWPRETLAACKDNKSYRIAHGLE